MDNIEALHSVEEIKKLFASRIRYMDLKQWDMYGSVHTEDAISESYGNLPPELQPMHNGIRNKIMGPAALTETIRKFIEDPVPMTTCHHAHQPEIELTSPDTATGIWPMEDHLWWRNGDTDEFLHGYGHYYEHYRKTNGRWLICYRKLTRLRVDTSSGFYDRLK